MRWSCVLCAATASALVVSVLGVPVMAVTDVKPVAVVAAERGGAFGVGRLSDDAGVVHVPDDALYFTEAAQGKYVADCRQLRALWA